MPNASRESQYYRLAVQVPLKALDHQAKIMTRFLSNGAEGTAPTLATVINAKRKDENALQYQGDRPSRKISPPTSVLRPIRPKALAEGRTGRWRTEKKCCIQWTLSSMTHWTITTTASQINSLNAMIRVPKRVAKWARWLQVQMETNNLDSFDPKSIIGLISTFKHACGTNGIHEGADMWPLPLLTKELAAAALDSGIVLLPKSCKYPQHGMLASYT